MTGTCTFWGPHDHVGGGNEMHCQTGQNDRAAGGRNELYEFVSILGGRNELYCHAVSSGFTTRSSETRHAAVAGLLSAGDVTST